MKRIFTSLSILIILSSALQAQSISVEDETLALQSDDLTMFEYVVESKLQNNTAQDVEYVWRKNFINCVEGWTVSMCIGELCYAPWVDTKDETLDEPEGKWSLHLADTDGETGTCDVCVDFWAIGDSDTLTTCALFEIGTTSNEEADVLNVSFYPNPVTDVLNVEVDREIEIVINNALGQIQERRILNVGRHTVLMDQLKRGLYTISFVVDGKVHLTRQLIKK
ncbi:MAG TPA: T9SS type A sorting domain-containing protein [Saprospiraceae bacterium]|nr:T9SS type A sorting domain-containing protein [Saprospiraceae bacterium]